MKNTLLLAILAGALGGLAGAAAVLVLGGPDADAVSASPVAPARPAPADPALGAELRDELAAVRDETRRLSRRLRELEERPAAATRQPVPAEAEGARVHEEARELLAALGDAGAAVPPALAQSVREVYEDIQEEERREREASWAEARESMLNARIERLTDELGLDDYQANEMRVILGREQERREELFREARETGNWMALREEMGAIREERDTALSQVLTPSQLESFEEQGRRGPFGRPPRDDDEDEDGGDRGGFRRGR